MFTLETPRLVLRSFLETDVRTFAAYRSDPLVARFQSWEIPYTLEQATAFVAAMARAEPGRPGEWFQVAIERTSDGTMIGDCAFQVLAGDTRQACVGLTLAREHQGRGYATEALVRLLDHLLDERGLHRVVAICDASNRASQRLLERVGMSLEGRFRENVRFKGTWGSECSYAVLGGDWRAARAAGSLPVPAPACGSGRAACAPPVRILCFGDSNTWGYDPRDGTRFAHTARWTGVMADALGSGYEVVEEGLNGRTTARDDPLEANRNGRTFLEPCLESHAPLDLVVIMLGTNDLKARFGLTPGAIADGAGQLVGVVRSSAAGPGGAAPLALLVAPPRVGRLREFDEMFAGAEEKSRHFPSEFARVARERGCAFLDAGAVVAPCVGDGVHLDAGAHRALGVAASEAVLTLLGASRAAWG